MSKEEQNTSANPEQALQAVLDAPTQVGSLTVHPLTIGRYALLEFKLGSSEIDEGAKHLCEIERLIKEYNEKEKQMPLRLPDLKIVITGTQYGYRREDGVFVIPIGCLKD